MKTIEETMRFCGAYVTDGRVWTLNLGRGFQLSYCELLKNCRFSYRDTISIPIKNLTPSDILRIKEIFSVGQKNSE